MSDTNQRGGDTASPRSSGLYPSSDDSPERTRALRAAASVSSFGTYDSGSPSKSDPDRSPIDDRKRPKNRTNNLAAFSAKLSSGTGVLGSGIKSKMFRQSKTDLRSLRKKADMALPLNDRSPMARSSKELGRIAALGTPMAGQGSPNDPPPPRKHHISFRKKDSPQAVLSSSSSNSRLASEGSVYSFHGPMAQTIAGEALNFKTKEECVSFMANSWSLLCSRTQNVFTDGSLPITVEDANTLVTLHFAAHVQSGSTAIEMIDRLDELLTMGIRSSAPLQIPASADALRRLAESWQFLFCKMLPPVEAIFIPLQLEAENEGKVFKSPDESAEYWDSLKKERKQLSIRASVLRVYRDVIILPQADNIKAAIMQGLSIRDAGADISDQAARITQCVNVLALQQTGDSEQSRVDELSRLLRESWVSRPRIAKDRRGLVLKKVEPQYARQ